MSDQTEQYYWDLIASKLSGNISTEDDAILSQWLDNSKANRRIFAEADELWQKAKNKDHVKIYPNIHQEWLAFQQSIQQQSEKRKSNVIRNIYPLSRTLAIAASISLFFATLIFVWQQSKTNWTTYQTKDLVMTIILPDSSVVWLNQDSELKVNTDFTERRVELKGEGYFQIKRNKKSPFVVETGNGFIKVLGTSFNVKANDTISIVSVLSGKVRIEDSESHSKELMILEQGTIMDNTVSKVKITVETFQDWRLKNNPQYSEEVNNVLHYLSLDYSWKKNAFNNSVLKGSLRNTAMLAEYDSVLLEIQFSRPNGKVVKTSLLLKEQVKPGNSQNFSSRLFDIFSKTEDVNVKIVSASVRD